MEEKEITDKGRKGRLEDEPKVELVQRLDMILLQMKSQQISY